jgi:hypothetical protein
MLVTIPIVSLPITKERCVELYSEKQLLSSAAPTRFLLSPLFCSAVFTGELLAAGRVRMGSRNIMDGGVRSEQQRRRATGKREKRREAARARLRKGPDECEKRAIETVAVSLAAD